MLDYLLHTGIFVKGVFEQTSDTFEVRNPFDNTLVARVANATPQHAINAIQAATDAFPEWKNKTASERKELLLRWHQLILKHKEDLATLLTAEMGKPKKEALGEILYGASFVEWFAEEGQRAYGETIPAHNQSLRILTIKQPVGVVAAITPWNFPNAMITRKIAPALAAGCTVVLKPSEETPLSALALAQLSVEAGFPAGVLNILPTMDADGVGQVFTASPLVRKLSFTGSTSVGKQLMAQCAGTVKKLSLELGGNAPFIIFDDADVQQAVEGTIASKFRNAGQTCICANRIFVQKGIATAYIQALTKSIQQLETGNGMEADTDIGPLINTKALYKLQTLLHDATSKGAQIQTGGHTLKELLFEPTLLTGVSADMDIHHAEIFGPLAAVTIFESDEEVIKLANDTPYGLASYFYARDVQRVWRVAEALEYGMVGVNTGAISTAIAPFGGVKESGFGKEGGHYGLEEYLETKYICLNIGY